MAEMNYLKDLCTLVVDFLKTTPKYPRDHPKNISNSDTYDNGEKNVIVVNYKDSNSKSSAFMTPTSRINIVRKNMIDRQVTKVFGEEHVD